MWERCSFCNSLDMKCYWIHQVNILHERKWKLLSCVWFFETPGTIQSMGFSSPKYWNKELFPSPGDLPNSGIKPRSRELQADSLPTEKSRKPIDSLHSPNLNLPVAPYKMKKQGFLFMSRWCWERVGLYGWARISIDGSTCNADTQCTAQRREEARGHQNAFYL